MKQEVLLLLRCTTLLSDACLGNRDGAFLQGNSLEATSNFSGFHVYFHQMGRRCFIMLNKVSSHCCMILRLQIHFLSEVTHEQNSQTSDIFRL